MYAEQSKEALTDKKTEERKTKETTTAQSGSYTGGGSTSVQHFDTSSNQEDKMEDEQHSVGRWRNNKENVEEEKPE